MHRILLTDRLDEASEARLGARADVALLADCAPESLTEALRDCDGVIVRTATRLPRSLLEAAGNRLRVVGVAGVGTENVDLEAAAERGIAVLNVPEAASDAVAELTVALMLNLLRPIRRLSSDYSRGEFATARKQPHGDELRRQTVGIVGLGRIGRRVARICTAGFGCHVRYNDIVDVGPLDFPAESVTKEELWAASDIITVHTPLTPQTRGLIDTSVLAALRPDARLINTARGAIVDTAALVAALQSGRLAGAGLDVTDPEPLPTNHPLFAMEQCVLTPHVASRTHAGLRNMFAVVDRVLEYLDRAADPG